MKTEENTEKSERLVDRGGLFASQTLGGTWTLAVKADGTVDDGYGIYLTRDQMREAAGIVNRWSKAKPEYISALKGVRDVAEATKDVIPEDCHPAIDMLLMLIDRKIDYFDGFELSGSDD